MARGDRITPLQEAFCREHVIDGAKANAALRAGFKGSYNAAAVQASKWLKMPKINSRIEELSAARIKRLETTADMVLAEIAKRALTDTVTLYEAVKQGGIEGIPKDMRFLVKGIVPTQWGDKIILCDKDANLKLLAEHFNLFKDHQGAGATKLPEFDLILMDAVQRRLSGGD